MNKIKIQNYMGNAGLIPVFYHPDCEIVKKVIKACYEGGCKVFEYTDRGEKAKANFPHLKKFMIENCNDMILGIGSVLNAQQAAEFIKLGADFIVSPVLDEETGEWCFKNNIYWIPGCGTLSECARALRLGADVIKIFPGNVLGSGFVKAVLGPMPKLKLMPTGGVEPTEKSISEWFQAGVVCVGMGSRLIPKVMIEKDNYEDLTSKIQQLFIWINKYKII